MRSKGDICSAAHFFNHVAGFTHSGHLIYMHASASMRTSAYDMNLQALSCVHSTYHLRPTL